MPFSKKSENTFCPWNQYSKQLSVLSFIKYKQVVRKIALSELLTNIERRKYTFLKARLAPEFAVKERAINVYNVRYSEITK